MRTLGRKVSFLKKYYQSKIMKPQSVKKTLLALQESEERYRQLVELSPDAIIVHSEGKIIFANKSATELYEQPLEEFIGTNIRTIIHESYHDIVLERIETIISQNVSTPLTEIRTQRMDGTILYVEVTSSPLIMQGKLMLQTIVRDITEKKIIEREMARLECLNIIGEIAAAIGHEIRNPLTSVHGFLQMLGAKEECLPFKEYYELMIEELNRANSIISEFLLLAKDKPIILKKQNLNNCINSIFPLIEADALNSDKFVVLKLDHIPHIVIDQKEIRQLIWNLVRNGLEAMEEGGTLVIETYYSNGEVTLAIKDDGKGFDPSILEKVGVPFITTKEKGTGLGLAICLSIVKRHNAKIEITSNSYGTIVLVRFVI